MKGLMFSKFHITSLLWNPLCAGPLGCCRWCLNLKHHFWQHENGAKVIVWGLSTGHNQLLNLIQNM